MYIYICVYIIYIHMGQAGHPPPPCGGGGGGGGICLYGVYGSYVCNW